MTTNVNITPYRQFPGTAREAMETYQSIFGGELQLMPFSEVHSPEEIGEQGDKIMHAELIINDRAVLFASDILDGYDRQKGEDTPLAITGGAEQVEAIRDHWEKLAAGGTVEMPLETVPWGATYGQLIDRFGTVWMFNIAGE